MVYLKLLRRGYKLYAGKQDNGEVDFIVINDSETEYYLDHNPKYMLTLDDDTPTSSNGIKQLYILE